MENRFEDIHDSVIRNFTGKSYSEKERLEIRDALEERNKKKKGKFNPPNKK